jgi:hypothetical protein
MALFEENFQIVNNTNQTLTLDPKGSSGLSSPWPATIAPNSSSATFKQTGNAQINLTAVYVVGNSGINAYLHFYLWGVGLTVHVNMTLSYSADSVYVNNTIWESNNLHGQKPESRSGPAPLTISKTNDSSTRGTAVFTLG